MNNIKQLESTLEWRDIDGYEGEYKVSEYGDVMSVKYGKKKLLKPGQSGHGYLAVVLCKNGKTKRHLVHRLVATAFCENTDQYEQVNHIDEDKTNNHYSNLEWCTRKHNINHGTRNQRTSEKMVGNTNGSRRKVRCIELDIVFDSTTEAANYVGGHPTSITACCRGKYNTHRKYHWEYVN